MSMFNLPFLTYYRSSSLLEIRPVDGETQELNNGNSGLGKPLDWLRRKKRSSSVENDKMEEMYVGNTLLKQKPRLRVRNAHLQNQEENKKSRKNSASFAGRSRSKNEPEKSDSLSGSDLLRIGSTEFNSHERSDMEQVFTLYFLSLYHCKFGILTSLFR